MAKGDIPAYHLHAMNKATDEKNRVGVAWNQPDGSISISLNPFVVLSSHKDLVLRLFPNREAGNTTAYSPKDSPAIEPSEISRAAQAYRDKSSDTRLSPEIGDDIPF